MFYNLKVRELQRNEAIRVSNARKNDSNERGSVMSNYKNSYKVQEKELVSLSVYNVGFQKCDPLYQWGPGIRDHYLIHYIISGKGTYLANGRLYELTAGDCFLVYPNTEVIYQADADEPWEYTWVGFAGSDAAMILRATDFSKEHPVILQFPDGEEVKRQLLHIYDARGNGFEHAVEMTGRLYTALAVFMHGTQKSSSLNSANTYVQKSIEYISSNYSYPIAVEDIAAYVGLSRSHLFRSFETVLGVSPKEYLTDFRIKQACYLLEHSSLSITAIANSIGFDNSLYFSKAFHKSKGISPREYRKQKR
jgi:AraC-like DNA-binding protein/mannose-6-phosphate isomerase-like protein (cupin superfamily)